MRRTMRLSDPDAPFFFRAGEHVAWRRWNGAPDREFRGTVVDAVGTFTLPGGPYSATYYVQRGDGQIFRSSEVCLVRVPAPSDVSECQPPWLSGGS